MAVRSIRRFVEASRKKLIPLVATPFMGEIGQKLCEEADVCWMDLSGNAHLVGAGLRVIIEGKPNQFKRPGRPRSVFAPHRALDCAVGRVFLGRKSDGEPGPATLGCGLHRLHDQGKRI